MSQHVKDPNDKMRNDLKPFCPIHHWRMAHDSGSTKVGPSYRCSYDGCTVRYTQAQGYFELNNPADAQNFVVNAEILCCTYNPQHRPRNRRLRQGINRQPDAENRATGSAWPTRNLSLARSFRRRYPRRHSRTLSPSTPRTWNMTTLCGHDKRTVVSKAVNYFNVQTLNWTLSGEWLAFPVLTKNNRKEKIASYAAKALPCAHKDLQQAFDHTGA